MLITISRICTATLELLICSSSHAWIDHSHLFCKQNSFLINNNHKKSSIHYANAFLLIIQAFYVRNFFSNQSKRVGRQCSVPLQKWLIHWIAFWVYFFLSLNFFHLLLHFGAFSKLPTILPHWNKHRDVFLLDHTTTSHC